MTRNPFLFGTLALQFEIELLSRYVFANFCSERYDEKFLFVGASAPQFQSIIKQVRFMPCVVHRLYAPKRLIMTKKKTPFFRSFGSYDRKHILSEANRFCMIRFPSLWQEDSVETVNIHSKRYDKKKPVCWSFGSTISISRYVLTNFCPVSCIVYRLPLTTIKYI